MLKSYFKNLGADLRAGKPLLHPILVTAAFLAVRQICYYIIFHFIFDRWYGWDFIGKGIFVFMLEFTCSAYFITLCTHYAHIFCSCERSDTLLRLYGRHLPFCS